MVNYNWRLNEMGVNKNKKTAYLLWLIVGLVGGHNFYLNKPKKGIVKIAILGIFIYSTIISAGLLPAVCIIIDIGLWLFDLLLIKKEYDKFNQKTDNLHNNYENMHTSFEKKLSNERRMLDEYIKKNGNYVGPIVPSWQPPKSNSYFSVFLTPEEEAAREKWFAEHPEEASRIKEEERLKKEQDEKEEAARKKWLEDHPEEAARLEEEKRQRHEQYEADRRMQYEQAAAEKQAKKEKDDFERRQRSDKIKEDSENRRKKMKEQATAREQKRIQERDKNREERTNAGNSHIVQRQSTVKICGTCQHWNGTRKPSNVSRIWAEFDENEKSMCHNALGGRQMKKGSDRCQKWEKWSNIK
jgi:TM2 domain-containing membrane protein YozV